MPDGYPQMGPKKLSYAEIARRQAAAAHADAENARIRAALRRAEIHWRGGISGPNMAAGVTYSPLTMAGVGNSVDEYNLNMSMMRDPIWQEQMRRQRMGMPGIIPGMPPNLGR